MNSLKKFALIGLVAPLLFSLLSFTNAVAGIGDLVTVRVHESISNDPKIIIASKGESKTINLEKGKTIVTDRNTTIISNTLEQYNKEGYKVETSNTIWLSGSLITTYILTK